MANQIFDDEPTYVDQEALDRMLAVREKIKADALALWAYRVNAREDLTARGARVPIDQLCREWEQRQIERAEIHVKADPAHFADISKYPTWPT
jgi:hypothetical protein